MVRAVSSRRGAVAHEHLEVVPFERPTLAAGEALVEVLAAPINPSDLLTLTGQYGLLPPLPARAGAEGCGRVVEVAGAAPVVGQLVLLPPGVGTWASHVVVPAGRLLPLPEADPEQLAMLAVNPPTAALLLRDFVADGPGAWVLQNAANSGVGSAVVQLARQRGLKTVNVVRRETAAAQVSAQGADVVLVDGEHLAERVRDATSGAPLRLALDAVGGAATGRLAAALADGGVVVNYGALSGEPCSIAARDLVFRDVSVKGFWLARWFRDTPPGLQAALMHGLADLVATNVLRAPVHARYPVEDIKAAVAAAAAGEREGKVLVVPGWSGARSSP